MLRLNLPLSNFPSYGPSREYGFANSLFFTSFILRFSRSNAVSFLDRFAMSCWLPGNIRFPPTGFLTTEGSVCFDERGGEDGEEEE